MQKIVDELKIEEYLGDLFNEKDRNMILAMALNRVILPQPCITLKRGMRIPLFLFSGLSYL